MTEPKIGVPSLAFVEKWVEEDEPLQTARQHAAELGTCVPIGSGTGAALRFLAAAIDARAVVEVGTGAGTSGIVDMFASIGPVRA